VAKRERRTRAHGYAREDRQRDPTASAIGRAAVAARDSLAERFPSQSSKRPAGRLMVAILLALTGATVLGANGASQLDWLMMTVAWLFAGIGALRALACFVPATVHHTPSPTEALDIVPVWTILIALYKEADSVPSLLGALSQLNWPAKQLDIIFACERDDSETLRILTAFQKQHDFRIVRVPSGGPRTKPNALQTALPFARGRFLTVYDAEDRPDPDQLRSAFHAFIEGPDNLAVVQALLVTWNHKESWIAHQFALDYAVWFRVMLPALARMSGVLPLGGTSNHFRTDILRQVGGWDPYNVTEDADLGIRLGRQGYSASLISSPTYEEAPPRTSAWVKQRGRWIQGHIQTFSLHLREPIKLFHQIGWRGVLAFVVGLGIGPMSAIFVLPMMLCLLACLLHDDGALVCAPFLLGFIGHILASVVAAHRDGRWSLLWSAATLPLYHCLQSLAACRAIWRVVFTPFIWDKTDHGCAARVKAARIR
jgi:glycosyltransferase XagB